MLPSSGYFRNVACPFFSSGLCERPHCQFEHKTIDALHGEKPLPQLHEGKALPSTVNDAAGDYTCRPDLLYLVQQAIRQVQKEVDEDDLPKADSDVKFIEIDVADAVVPSGKVHELDKLNRENQMRSDVVAEYKPTPIIELKKRKDNLQRSQFSKLEYKPPFLTSGKGSQSPTLVYIPSSKREQDATTSCTPNPQVQVSTSNSAVKEMFSDSSEDSIHDLEDLGISDEGICRTNSASTINVGCDILNKILSESIQCDTLMTAASVRRTSDSKCKVIECTQNKGVVTRPNMQMSVNNCSKMSGNSKDVSVMCKTKKFMECAINKFSKKSVLNKKSIASPRSTVKLGLSRQPSSKVDPLKNHSSVTVQSKKNRSEKNIEKCQKQSTINLNSFELAKANESTNLRSLVSAKRKSQSTLESGEDSSCEGGFASNSTISDVDEDETYEECLKIFNDYVPEKGVDPTAIRKAGEQMKFDTADQVMACGKKRTAHNPNHVVKRVANNNQCKPLPAQVMHARFIHVQKVLDEAKVKNSCQSSKPSNSSDGVGNSDLVKRRIAHLPCGASSKDLNLLSNVSHRQSLISNKADTLAEVGSKGNQRITNRQVMSVRPIIPAEFGSRVPTNIRQRYLNIIIDECLKFYDCDQDAFERGCAEEKNAYERSSNRAVYLNVVANTIKRLRAEQPGMLNSSATCAVNMKSCVKQQRIMSHEFVLGGKKAASVSYSIERPRKKSINTPLSGVQLYQALSSYILTKQQLYDNGFPMVHPTESGRAVINKLHKKKGKSYDAMEKVCSRCSSLFKVSPKGEYLKKEECFYHWGRAIKVRDAGAYETRYTCCQTGLHSEGCCVGKLHVFDDIDENCFKGFVKTLPKSPPSNFNYGVFSLDCEMCYTTMGIELARVTVIAPDLSPIYESLVKPENPVIDYNTRFSGIVESDLATVDTTLHDVQAILLSKFSDKTILIGHSLESDLKALKLIHETVVDTSIVFPHKMGFPYKRALRTLVAEYLKKIIQNSPKTWVWHVFELYYQHRFDSLCKSHKNFDDVTAVPRGFAPADTNSSDEDLSSDSTTPLGIVPHQIRGFLSLFYHILPLARCFNKCTACSDVIIEEYTKNKSEFLINTFNRPSYLEDLSGLTQLHNDTQEALVWELSDDADD